MSIHFSTALPIASIKSLTTLTPHEDPFVDGLRGLSVLMVIWFHTLYAVNFAFDPEFFQQYLLQFPAWLRFVFGTDKAVDIFFMISAFLLGSSLRRQANNGNLQVTRFYIHRFFRIYPLFLIALFLFGLGEGASFFEKLIPNLLFIDNYYHNTIIPVGWSLSVEMQCYLVLPLVIFIAHKSKQPLPFLWLLLFASIAARAYAALHQPESYLTPFLSFLTEEADSHLYMDTLYYSTPGRASSFVMGLIWAYTINSSTLLRLLSFIRKSPYRYHGCLIVCLIVLVTSMNFPVYVATSSYYQSFNSALNLISVVIHRWAFCMALLGLILLTQQDVTIGIGGYIRTALTQKFWRPFSKMAFPIYLFHFPFIVLGWLLVLRTTNLDDITQITIWQTVLAALFTTLLVSWFAIPFHFKIEQKGIQLGKKLATRF